MSIQSLLKALNDLSDIHEDLLQLAHEKQRLVIENRVDQLVALTAKESKAIAAMDKLNDDIRHFTRECWTELGLAQKPGAVLSELVQAVHRVEWKSALTEAADRLKSQIGQLKELNDRNQMLVQQSLDYIRFALDLLSDPYDDITYSPARPVSGGAPRRTFETQA